MMPDQDADDHADPNDEKVLTDVASTDEQGGDGSPKGDGTSETVSREDDTFQTIDVGSNKSTRSNERSDSDSELIPAIAQLADARGHWPMFTTDSKELATREVERDLTPDDIEIDRPDEFDFGYIPTEDLPTGVQYTPDFDPDWVYPSGSSDGGRQDDTPVQGLEIGVVGTNETIEATVRAVLDAIALYYDDTGQYPRHRIIESASAFEEAATDGIGLVAVLQPSPDNYDGLMDHMQAVQSNADGAVNSNFQTSRRLVQYLGAQLVADNLATLPEELDIVAATGWKTGAQVGTLPIVERYAPLGAAEVYDPTIEDLDLSEDGVASVAEVEFTPRRLSIETTSELFEVSEDAD
jgi:hypothetical protein